MRRDTLTSYEYKHGDDKSSAPPNLKPLAGCACTKNANSNCS